MISSNLNSFKIKVVTYELNTSNNQCTLKLAGGDSILISCIGWNLGVREDSLLALVGLSLIFRRSISSEAEHSWSEFDAADFLRSFIEFVATLRDETYSSTESGEEVWTGLTFTSRPKVSRRFSLDSFPGKKCGNSYLQACSTLHLINS